MHVATMIIKFTNQVFFPFKKNPTFLIYFNFIKLNHKIQCFFSLTLSFPLQHNTL